MMILNDFEYKTTKERLEGFKKALTLLNAPDNQLRQKNPFMWQLNIDGLQSFIEDFTVQMQEYEELINKDLNEPVIFEIDSIKELPRILVKARIAVKISQQELADRLGISLKQFQRYEDWEYQEATLTLLLEVSQALGIQIQQKIPLFVTNIRKIA